MHSRNSCKTLKCPKCNWHYKYQETLEIHMKEKHPENELNCFYCLHNQEHPRKTRGGTFPCGYKPYRCEVCDYATTTKGNLQIHESSEKHQTNKQHYNATSSTGNNPALTSTTLASNLINNNNNSIININNNSSSASSVSSSPSAIVGSSNNNNNLGATTATTTPINNTIISSSINLNNITNSGSNSLATTPISASAIASASSPVSQHQQLPSSAAQTPDLSLINSAAAERPGSGSPSQAVDSGNNNNGGGQNQAVAAVAAALLLAQQQNPNALEDYINTQEIAKDSYEDPSRKYKCHRCKVAFTRQSYLTAHNKTLFHRKGEKLAYPMEKYLDPNRPFKCDICKESFTQKSILLVHNNSVSHLNKLRQKEKQQQQQQQQQPQQQPSSAQQQEVAADNNNQAANLLQQQFQQSIQPQISQQQQQQQSNPLAALMAAGSGADPMAALMAGGGGNPMAALMASGAMGSHSMMPFMMNPHLMAAAALAAAQTSRMLDGSGSQNPMSHFAAASQVSGGGANSAASGQQQLPAGNPFADFQSQQQQLMQQAASQLAACAQAAAVASSAAGVTSGSGLNGASMAPPTYSLGNLLSQANELSQLQQAMSSAAAASSASMAPTSVVSSLTGSHSSNNKSNNSAASNNSSNAVSDANLVSSTLDSLHNINNNNNASNKQQSSNNNNNSTGNNNNNNNGIEQATNQQQQAAAAAAAAAAALSVQQQKRARTRISEEQLRILRQYFDINNSPTEEQLQEMSVKSELPLKVIKHWFRNTLFKERQKNKDSPYNFNNPPMLALNLEEYERTGEAKVTPISDLQHQLPAALNSSSTDLHSSSSTTTTTMNALSALRNTNTTGSSQVNLESSSLQFNQSDGSMVKMEQFDSSSVIPKSSDYSSSRLQQPASSLSPANLQQQLISQTDAIKSNNQLLAVKQEPASQVSGGDILMMIRSNQVDDREADADDDEDDDDEEEDEEDDEMDTCDEQAPTATPGAGNANQESGGSIEAAAESVVRAVVAAVATENADGGSSSPVPTQTGSAGAAASSRRSRNLRRSKRVEKRKLSPVSDENNVGIGPSATWSPLELQQQLFDQTWASVNNHLMSSNNQGLSSKTSDSSSHSVQSSTNSKSKRANRTRFSDRQVRVLQDFFETNAYPKDDDLECLSQQLGLSPRVIVVWFQNARQKARKVYENRPTSASMSENDDDTDSLLHYNNANNNNNSSSQLGLNPASLNSSPFVMNNSNSNQLTGSARSMSRHLGGGHLSPMSHEGDEGDTSTSGGLHSPSGSMNQDNRHNNLHLNQNNQQNFQQSVANQQLHLQQHAANQLNDLFMSHLANSNNNNQSNGQDLGGNEGDNEDAMDLDGEGFERDLEDDCEDQLEPEEEEDDDDEFMSAAQMMRHQQQQRQRQQQQQAQVQVNQQAQQQQSQQFAAAAAAAGLFGGDASNLLSLLAANQQASSLLGADLHQRNLMEALNNAMRGAGAATGNPLSGLLGSSMGAAGNNPLSGVHLSNHHLNSSASLNLNESSNASNLSDHHRNSNNNSTGNQLSGGGNGGQNNNNSTSSPSASQRDKRLRTQISPEQLDYLYQKYQVESNPSRKTLESIAQDVGLSKRVVQVWFQNTRARERRGQLRMSHVVAQQQRSQQQQQQGGSLTGSGSVNSSKQLSAGQQNGNGGAGGLPQAPATPTSQGNTNQLAPDLTPGARGIKIQQQDQAPDNAAAAAAMAAMAALMRGQLLEGGAGFAPLDLSGSKALFAGLNQLSALGVGLNFDPQQQQ